MDLHLVERNEKRLLEGPVGRPLIRSVTDVREVIEACFNYQTTNLLLYPENLTDHFFDLSSLEAGEILQKLRMYQIRCAVVLSPDSGALSRRFADLMVEENRDRYFRLVQDRSTAEAWLLED